MIKDSLEYVDNDLSGIFFISKIRQEKRFADLNLLYTVLFRIFIYRVTDRTRILSPICVTSRRRSSRLRDNDDDDDEEEGNAARHEYRLVRHTAAPSLCSSPALKPDADDKNENRLRGSSRSNGHATPRRSGSRVASRKRPDFLLSYERRVPNQPYFLSILRTHFRAVYILLSRKCNALVFELQRSRPEVNSF